MDAHWQNEKDAIAEIRELQGAARGRAHRGRAGRARGRPRAGRGAPLRHHARARAPRSRRRPSASTSCRPTQQMLKEEVDEEDVAEIVAKWTGIPVSRLMEGEMSKLVRMEDVLHERVVGQDDAVARGRQRHPPLARRAVRPATGRSARSCSSARPASARPSWPARSPTSCSTTSGRWSASTCRSTRRSTPCRASSARLPGYVGYDEGGQLTEAVRRRPVRGRAARRDREGAPRRVQRAAAAARRRPAHRRPGPHRRLHQRRAHHDEQPRRRRRRGGGDERGARRTSSPSSSTASTRSCVFHRLDEAHIERIVEHPARAAAAAAGGARPRARGHRRRPGAHRRTRATTPTSGPGRSSG